MSCLFHYKALITPILDANTFPAGQDDLDIFSKQSFFQTTRYKPNQQETELIAGEIKKTLFKRGSMGTLRLILDNKNSKNVLPFGQDFEEVGAALAAGFKMTDVPFLWQQYLTTEESFSKNILIEVISNLTSKEEFADKLWFLWSNETAPQVRDNLYRWANQKEIWPVYHKLVVEEIKKLSLFPPEKGHSFYTRLENLNENGFFLTKTELEPLFQREQLPEHPILLRQFLHCLTPADKLWQTAKSLITVMGQTEPAINYSQAINHIITVENQISFSLSSKQLEDLYLSDCAVPQTREIIKKFLLLPAQSDTLREIQSIFLGRFITEDFDGRRRQFLQDLVLANPNPADLLEVLARLKEQASKGSEKEAICFLLQKMVVTNGQIQANFLIPLIKEQTKQSNNSRSKYGYEEPGTQFFSFLGALPQTAEFLQQYWYQNSELPELPLLTGIIAQNPQLDFSFLKERAALPLIIRGKHIDGNRLWQHFLTSPVAAEIILRSLRTDPPNDQLFNTEQQNFWQNVIHQTRYCEVESVRRFDQLPPKIKEEFNELLITQLHQDEVDSTKEQHFGILWEILSITAQAKNLKTIQPWLKTNTNERYFAIAKLAKIRQRIHQHKTDQQCP